MVVQSTVVCLYATLLSFISTWHIPFLPFKSGVYSGLACFCKDYDIPSTIFWWLVFVPAFLLIPLRYVLWCVLVIFRQKMLPPAGRRRNLAVYFFRLVFASVFMWLSFIIVAFVWGALASDDGGEVNSWIFWAGASWSHLQGLISVLISLTKPRYERFVLGYIGGISRLRSRRSAR